MFATRGRVVPLCVLAALTLARFTSAQILALQADAQLDEEGASTS